MKSQKTESSESIKRTLTIQSSTSSGASHCTASPTTLAFIIDRPFSEVLRSYFRSRDVRILLKRSLRQDNGRTFNTLLGTGGALLSESDESLSPVSSALCSGDMQVTVSPTLISCFSSGGIVADLLSIFCRHLSFYRREWYHVTDALDDSLNVALIYC